MTRSLYLHWDKPCQKMLIDEAINLVMWLSLKIFVRFTPDMGPRSWTHRLFLLLMAIIVQKIKPIRCMKVKIWVRSIVYLTTSNHAYELSSTTEGFKVTYLWFAKKHVPFHFTPTVLFGYNYHYPKDFTISTHIDIGWICSYLAHFRSLFHFI